VIDVVVADDHALLREGTRQILERTGEFRVVAEAADGQEAVAQVEAHRPGVLLLDFRLPGLNGVEVAQRLGTSVPETRILMLSAFDEVGYVRAALSAGVAGYLLKTALGEELVGAVRAVASGVSVLDPSLSEALSGAAPRVGGPGFTALTSRELEVVRLVAQGLSNKAIAATLSISPRTVEGHLNHIFEKVGARSRAALVRYAMDHGLAVGG
jgi:DNA-binding NarL/FixJ family response regulator